MEVVAGKLTEVLSKQASATEDSINSNACKQCRRVKKHVVKVVAGREAEEVQVAIRGDCCWGLGSKEAGRESTKTGREE